MTVKKLVSIGVPAYNEEDCIKDCLESIAADAYPYKEIIISDNASSDSTWRIIEEFKKDYDDLYDIVIIQQEENKGSAYNFNYVLERSKGEFFVWAGAHDIWGNNFVNECVARLEDNQHFALVMPLVKWIDESSNVLDLSHCVIDTRPAKSPAERVLLLISQWKHCTAIYGVHRRRTLLNTLPWPRTLSNDNIALIRIAKQGDIVPAESTYYFRRARSVESPDVRICRQLRAMDVKGIATSKPRSTYILRLLSEVVSIRGPFRVRTQLFAKVLSRRFLGMVFLENCPFAYNALKRIKSRLSD